MGIVKKDVIHTQQKELTIYLILEERGTHFVVDKCESASLYQTYRNHYSGRRVLTKELFQEQKKQGRRPRMFLLESVTETIAEAYTRCLAWSKHLYELGYQPLATGKFLEQMEDLNETGQAIYEGMKAKKEDEIFRDCKELFPDYGRVKGYTKKEKNRTVLLRLTPDEFEKLRKQANKIGSTVPSFCKEAALKKKIVNIDVNPITDAGNQMREAVRILNLILFTVYSTGQYERADMVQIQQMADEIMNAQRDVLSYISKLIARMKRMK